MFYRKAQNIEAPQSMRDAYSSEMNRRVKKKLAEKEKNYTFGVPTSKAIRRQRIKSSIEETINESKKDPTLQKIVKKEKSRSNFITSKKDVDKQVQALKNKKD